MKNVKVRCFILLFVLISLTDGESNRFVFKIKSRFQEFEKILNLYNFTDMLKITPNVYSFKYDSFESRIKMEQALADVKRNLSDTIVEIEQAKELTIGTNWILVDSSREGNEDVEDIDSEPVIDPTQENVDNNAGFGMNVATAWSNGANGEGINIAVLDVGVNTNLSDLTRNIRATFRRNANPTITKRKNVESQLISISKGYVLGRFGKCLLSIEGLRLRYDVRKNFVDNTQNVVPEYFHSYQAESLYYVDHGNKCASVIAAERGNGICGDGIAYEAKVVPLKVFKVKERKHHFSISVSSDIFAAGLAHAPQQIHIYSNSWSLIDKFEPLDLSMREAILEGVSNGRDKLGSIYVVPDGSEYISGSGLASSINTITVNYVGFNGRLPRSPQISASVLTSGLGEGNRLDTSSILTSSLNDICTKTFKGGSAAVAELSAIIALALQARPTLTMRDIQHLLVESSSSKELPESVSFTTNAAGKLFNPVIGFGLIDAGKMVTLAKSWKSVGKLYSDKLHKFQIETYAWKPSNHFRYDSYRITYTNFFKLDEERCGPQVHKVEHVILFINYYIITQRSLKLEIVSPGGTHSLVVDNSDDPTFSTDQSDRNLTSVHFWGERPFGTWRVVSQLSQRIDTKKFESASLIVLGSHDDIKIQQNCGARETQTNTGHKPLEPTKPTTKKSNKKGKGNDEAPRFLRCTVVWIDIVMAAFVTLIIS